MIERAYESAVVLECQVAVIGGSLGGVAAALSAAEAGAHVVLTEATDWLGGQITNQGVSALDEHRLIESFGGTRSYYRLREGIRGVYQRRYGVTAMPDGRPLNPGNGWVSALCFEPRVGLEVINDMLQPHVESGRLRVLLEHEPVDATVTDNSVLEVVLRSARGDKDVRVRAAYYLDATDLGDLLPLTGTEYVTGAEAQSDTGEPHARLDGPHPDEVQGFTYCFAVTHCSGEDHTIPMPDGYARFRDWQPYTFVLRGHHGEPRPFRMFTTGPTGLPPFWTYRRLIDGSLFDPSGRLRDIAMINWSGNDYHWANVIDASTGERMRILDEAKRLALGFLYWLQTEAPHGDGKGQGYPGLWLLPETIGTADGLSKAPYIRESRRILALKRIVEDEIVASARSGARAAPFRDSVGIGWYAMDLHDCVGNPTSMFAPTLPFQIPLGALVPRRVSNLLAACKNVGTTHLTNGAYRLHPIEWNIGESAGVLAAHCCQGDATPQQVWEDPALLRRFQWRLLERGIPLAWTTDVTEAHPLFGPVQMLAVWGGIPADGHRADGLAIDLDDPLSGADAIALLEAGLSLLHRSLPRLPECWTERPEADVARADLARVLDASGLEAMIGDPPAWEDLAAVFAPQIERTLASE
jgi:hypothetical protein